MTLTGFAAVWRLRSLFEWMDLAALHAGDPRDEGYSLGRAFAYAHEMADEGVDAADLRSLWASALDLARRRARARAMSARRAQRKAPRAFQDNWGRRARS